MVALPQDYHLTLEEYLALERQTDIRHEYFHGQVFAMAGASRNHVVIAGNINREIATQLDERPCLVYMLDMRVKLDAKHYAYPDIAALCGEERFDATLENSLLNPSVIIEVLSPSTEGYDRGKKFEAYREIVTLQEYVLVSQDHIAVEHYRRTPEGWLLNSYHDLADVLTLVSLEATLPLAGVYRKVQFDLEDATPADLRV
ncbi:MAG: Uma2 family endonuclease [Phototrophicaceae bacterium]|jgi:Uma2 family endonuclease